MQQEFHLTVLETALENIVSKLRRHLQIKRPALEMLLQQANTQISPLPFIGIYKDPLVL